MNRRAQAFPADPLREPSRNDGSIRGVGSALNLDAVGETQRGREPTLVDHVWTVVEGRWTIAGVAASCLAAAFAYLFLAAPVYETNALVQVEDRPKTVAVLTDLHTMFEEKTPAEGEIEVIRSRALLGAVVEQLDLDIEARPRRFPVIGDAIGRRYHGQGPAAPVLGLSRFGWGGEQISVRRLDVSDDLLDDSMSLVALEGNRYRLSADGGRLQLEGKVGVAASAANGERRVQLLVSELSARPGTLFRVMKRRSADVVDWLQGQLRVIEKGKKTGVLLIELDGGDPRRIAAIVSAIATTYQRQNVDRRSSEAAKTLDFLESQLPVVKSDLDAAESALNAFKRRTRTVDLSREADATLDRASELDKARSELEVQRSELRQRFTDNHPILLSLDRKLETLRAESAAIGARLSAFPEAEADSARLVRNVKVATEMYLLLLNKAQELRVVKSGTIGNVRIVDQVRVPHRPSRPRAAAVLAIGLLLGLGGGIAAAMARRALDQRAEHPEEIEASTGIPVTATVPHSLLQAGLMRAARRNGNLTWPVLSAAHPEDVAIESLRSLRTSLQFALVESSNKIVAVMSPTAGAGKSFVALNLAHVFAAAGAKVVLFDGDLRRGQLHRHFGIERKPGLSEVVSGAVPLDAAIRGTREGRLYVLPTGSIPPNPAELLSGQPFELALKEASRRFDLVIVDTPPILAVTDSLLVSRFAGVNLLVLRAGHHPIREIALAVRRLRQTGIRVQGAVLNDLSSTRGRYGGSEYRYEYPAAPSD
jgi:tyrosine-protein kinase Etk/Wzc